MAILNKNSSTKFTLDRSQHKAPSNQQTQLNFNQRQQTSTNQQLPAQTLSDVFESSDLTSLSKFENLNCTSDIDNLDSIDNFADYNSLSKEISADTPASNLSEPMLMNTDMNMSQNPNPTLLKTYDSLSLKLQPGFISSGFSPNGNYTAPNSDDNIVSNGNFNQQHDTPAGNLPMTNNLVHLSGALGNYTPLNHQVNDKYYGDSLQATPVISANLLSTIVANTNSSQQSQMQSNPVGGLYLRNDTNAETYDDPNFILNTPQRNLLNYPTDPNSVNNNNAYVNFDNNSNGTHLNNTPAINLQISSSVSSSKSMENENWFSPASHALANVPVPKQSQNQYQNQNQTQNQRLRQRLPQPSLSQLNNYNVQEEKAKKRQTQKQVQSQMQALVNSRSLSDSSSQSSTISFENSSVLEIAKMKSSYLTLKEIAKEANDFEKNQSDFLLQNTKNQKVSKNLRLKLKKHSQIFALATIIKTIKISEGVVCPRNTVYSKYSKICKECGMEALCNAAFGKLIKVFHPGIKTRRLGTRGSSRYNYCGIELIEKPKSRKLKNSAEVTEDGQYYGEEEEEGDDDEEEEEEEGEGEGEEEEEDDDGDEVEEEEDDEDDDDDDVDDVEDEDEAKIEKDKIKEEQFSNHNKHSRPKSTRMKKESSSISSSSTIIDENNVNQDRHVPLLERVASQLELKSLPERISYSQQVSDLEFDPSTLVTLPSNYISSSTDISFDYQAGKLVNENGGRDSFDISPVLKNDLKVLPSENEDKVDPRWTELFEKPSIDLVFRIDSLRELQTEVDFTPHFEKILASVPNGIYKEFLKEYCGGLDVFFEEWKSFKLKSLMERIKKYTSNGMLNSIHQKMFEEERENLTPFINACDVELLKCCTKLMIKITFQYVPQRIQTELETFETSYHEFLKTLVFHDSFMKGTITFGKCFLKILGTMRRTVFFSSNFLRLVTKQNGDNKRREKFVKELVDFDFDKILESTPFLTAEVREKIGPFYAKSLKGVVKTLSKNHTNDILYRNEVINHCARVFTMMCRDFPGVGPKELLMMIDSLSSMVMRELTLSQATDSFSAWWILLSWCNEHILLLAQAGGYFEMLEKESIHHISQ